MPPQTRKRGLAAGAAASAAERSQGTGKRPKRKHTGNDTGDLQDEAINLAVSEPPQASKGNRFVDFEAILKHTNVLNAPDEAKAESEAVDAGSANKTTIFKSVLDNDDIEVVRCGGDDLSVHIPARIKDKIWKNQYININLLLKGSVELHDLCSGGTLKVSDSGILEKQPKFSKEKVPNLDKWTDAFVIFMSIYLKKRPQKTQELLQYMSVIRDAARKHGGLFWREYDEQFRIRQAAYASSWAQINSDLWLQIFAGSYQNLNNNQSTSGSNQSSLSNQSAFQSKKSLVTCRSFNQGYCSWVPCKFEHICSSCGQSSHGAWSCKQQSQPVMSIQNPIPRGNFRGFNEAV